CSSYDRFDHHVSIYRSGMALRLVPERPRACASSGPRWPDRIKGSIPSLNSLSSSAVALRSWVKPFQSLAVKRNAGLHGGPFDPRFGHLGAGRPTGRPVDLDRVEETGDVREFIEATGLGLRVDNAYPVSVLPPCRAESDHSASRVDWAQPPDGFA